MVMPAGQLNRELAAMLARSQPDCPKYTVGAGWPAGNRGNRGLMGNQQGKGGKRAAPSQTYPFDEPEKKSRTDWTAGRLDVSPLFLARFLPVANPTICPAQPFPCDI